MSAGWLEYKNEPCPVCGHKGWCGHTEDGNVIHCMRSPSKHACNGGGWLHFLVERPMRPRVAPRAPRRIAPRIFDAARTMAGFRAEFEEPSKGKDLFDSLVEIGKDLHLTACHIDRLNVGRSAFHGAWAFPMLDGETNIVGIRLREYGSSHKWSVAGSQDGLFYDPDLQPRIGLANGVKGREIVIVEGATDCIAGYCLNLPAVGRSSCGTGSAQLRVLCNRLKVQRVTIVTDNDAFKTRPDGSVWNAGRDGAQALAAKLGRTFRIVTPPKKDLREWYYGGCTAETFWMVANAQPWRIN